MVAALSTDEIFYLNIGSGRYMGSLTKCVPVILDIRGCVEKMIKVVHLDLESRDRRQGLRNRYITYAKSKSGTFGFFFNFDFYFKKYDRKIFLKM